MEVKPGYKQTEVGVIPEDWDVMPFNQVTDLITCGIAATPRYVPESQGYPFLSSTNVKDGRILWYGYKHISADLHRQLYRNNPPKKGDILYSRVGTFGEAAVVDVDFEFSVYVSLTLIKPGKPLDSLFLMHLLNSDTYKRRAKDQIYLGGGVGNLNVDVVRRYPIVLPPLPEQQAIAATLSDVDALLAKLDQLIAKERDLKQAAMQQLLTGQIRLPGFSGAWEVKRLGEVLHFQVGFPFGSDFFNQEGEGIRLVKNRDLKNDDQIFYYSGKFDEGFLVNNGDVLIGMDGDFLPCLWSKGTALLNQRVGRIVSSPRISSLFSYFMLMEPLKEIEYATSATTVKHLSHGDVEDIERALPDFEEQTAIATVLSDMDADIAALEARRDKTRDLKQGMMQELLTGRIRLI